MIAAWGLPEDKEGPRDCMGQRRAWGLHGDKQGRAWRLHGAKKGLGTARLADVDERSSSGLRVVGCYCWFSE